MRWSLCAKVTKSSGSSTAASARSASISFRAASGSASAVRPGAGTAAVRGPAPRKYRRHLATWIPWNFGILDLAPARIRSRAVR